MHIVRLIIAIMILTASTASADDEVSLFNFRGKADAYIAFDDDLNIYLWDGKPVAYLEKDGDDGGYHVYGFNRKHLGWFVSGIVWDHEGLGSCAVREALPSGTQLEPLKSLRQLTPLKSLTRFAPFRPHFKGSFGDTPCRFLLAEGGR